MQGRDPRLNNKWWRMTHLYKIKNKYGQLVLFKPNYAQLKHLSERRRQRRGRILKFRQGGFTTLYCIDYLDDVLWTPGYAAAIIAHERSTLDKIFLIVKRAYENMPPSVRPKTRQDTLRGYRFESTFDGQKLDSEIYVDLKLRGGTVQALHISERAYIVGQASSELEAGSKQAVPIDGRITEETTANGYEAFHDGFMANWGKVPGPYDTASYFYAWHEMPEYTLPGSLEDFIGDSATKRAVVAKVQDVVAKAYDAKMLTEGQLCWYLWKMDSLASSGETGGLRPEQYMRQEYPSSVMEAFQAGLGAVFDQELLAAQQGDIPIRTVQDGEMSGTQIWLEPRKRGDKWVDDEGVEKELERDDRFVMGADPSGGDADDETVIDIWLMHEDGRKEQAAQWSGLVRPDEAADIAAAMCEYYNHAFAGIENNMLSMILFFIKVYDNYFFKVKIDEKKQKKTKKVGWSTNTATRDPMIDEYRKEHEEGTPIIHSAKTLTQMKTFVKKENGKREHADGKHDDAVFSGMISLQMTKYYAKMSRNRSAVPGSKPEGW